MRILFLYPNINLAPRINHGLAALSAFMRKHGHQTALLQFDTEKSLRDLKKIEKIKPDVIGISSCTSQWGVVKFLAEEIKRKYDIKIFAGGIHPTTCPESLLESRALDGICRGEGEFPFLELAERMSKGQSVENVPNFWLRKGTGIIKNEIRSLVDDLDSLPIPDWSIFDKPTIHDYPNFSFSRGCVYNCRYCINSALREVYKGKGPYIRVKSVERAIDEIKDKVGKYGLKILNFDDDTFIKDKKWTLDFCLKYKKEIHLPFNCNTRVENINSEMCEMLKRSGGQKLLLGIESGDAEIRTKVLSRHMTDDSIIRAFSMAREAGLKTFSFNMLGIPGETSESFKKTIRLNKTILPDEVQLTMFTPYPATPLGELCLKKGYIKHKLAYEFANCSVLELPEFPRREIHKWYDRFEYLIYKNTDFPKAFKSRLSKFIHRHRILCFIFAPPMWGIKKLHTLKRKFKCQR